MGYTEVCSKVWGLPAAPASLAFGPAGVQGRRGPLAPSACLCRVVRELFKVGLGPKGHGRCRQSLPATLPSSCRAPGGGGAGILELEGVVPTPGSVDLVFVLFSNAKMKTQ